MFFLLFFLPIPNSASCPSTLLLQRSVNLPLLTSVTVREKKIRDVFSLRRVFVKEGHDLLYVWVKRVYGTAVVPKIEGDCLQ